MIREELEKATGQELIEQRDYCGVDGYYGDYLDDVNAEMLKRFNRLAELEKENKELDMKRKAERQIFQGIVEKKNDQLTKAKVALRKVVDYLGQYCSDYPDCVIEAEPFLKE